MASSCMNAPRIMVFRPTMKEMEDFSSYIAHMESKGAHLAGIAKVIPPKEFVPRKNYDNIEMTIPAPIQQEVMGHQGLYTQYNIQKKAMSVTDFKKMANSPKYCTPAHFDYEDLERKYWKNITYNPPIYGADISGSIYDEGWNTWNINSLNTILDLIEEEEGVKIEGVNTAYLYFGMWKTTFAWHTEDMDLYSINYIHYGAPKTWYSIPTEHARRLERLASGFFPGSFADCSNFLRHKMTVIAPYILKKYSIPFDKITQEVGEFMITFPYGYHAGFNHGYNIAESTNFASLRWINFGKRASSCTCSSDSVKIGMNSFVRVFQPDRYQAWMEGRDVIYIPEVDGPNPPTISHRQPPKSPEKVSKDKITKKVHRRHPVHKKGINGELRDLKSATKTKKIKVESKTTEDDEESESKKKKDEKKKKKQSQDMETEEPKVSLSKKGSTLKIKEEIESDEDSQESEPKKKKGEKKKKKRHQDQETKESKASLSKEEKKLKRKQKREKKRKHSKDKNEESSGTTFTKLGSKSPVIKVEHVCDLSQLAEAAERVASTSEMFVPSGANVGPSETSVGASGDVGSRREQASGANSQKNVTVKRGQKRVGDVRNEHTYSSSPSTSKTKKSKQQGTSQDDNSNNLDNVDDSNGCVDLDNIKKEAPKETITERSSSLIPTRTNPDGTQVCTTSQKGLNSKEMSKKKNWVRSMNGLWIIQPAQFISEQVHNLSMADQKPGCCVCMIFYNERADSLDWGDEDMAFSSSNSQLAGTSQDQRLRVLCPEICFACSTDNPSPVIESFSVDSDGRSPILNCVSCKIAVHASCYGEDPATASVEEWKCDRCKEDDMQAVCSLCNLRGGALKPTTTGNWAHIVCAMSVTEVSFQNIKRRSPIDVTNISPARLKLKCYYCRSFIKCSPKYSSCIQCSVGKCALSFHVTCAKAAGVMMEPSDWPYPVYATCCKHPFANRDIIRRGTLEGITTGERVIAKHRNSRYYEAEVIGEREQMFCHVNFCDNSFSENLFPEDIESHNLHRNGPPAVGTRVKVRWTDGVLYDGSYVKDTFIKIYDVEFQDTSIVTVKREDIYAEGEKLPKKVKMKLSVASDMRHQDFYGNKVIGDKHRQVSSRYAKQSSEYPDQSESSSSESKE